MPQKRNPDVFELVRGRTATAQACLVEALGIFAKLPSGYQRDLQLHQAAAVPRHRPVRATTLTSWPRPSRECASGPTASPRPADPRRRQANALVVREGIPFREAYRRVGPRLREG